MIPLEEKQIPSCDPEEDIVGLDSFYGNSFYGNFERY